MNNSVDKQLLSKKHLQLIQRKKQDLITVHIVEAEQKFNAEYTKMKENHRNLVKNKGMPTALSNLIEQRLKNIIDRWRDIYNYRVDFYLRSSYGDWENRTKKKKNTTEQSTINGRFVSQLISDTTHQLNRKQMQLLNRGPSYVPPCQMHTSSSSQSLVAIVKKQYAPLKHQLAGVFSKHHINIALSWEVNTTINQKFVDLFSISIPSNIHKRAVDEIKLVHSIRASLNKNSLILRRTADNRNSFYLGKVKDFEAKANEYLSTSDAYKVLTSIIDENDKQKWQSDLNGRVEAMNSALEILKRRKALDKKVIDKLVINVNKVKLPYLYFLPDVSKVRKSLLLVISAVIFIDFGFVRIGK